MSGYGTDDIVDLLLRQHERITESFAAVHNTAGTDQKLAFSALISMLHTHEHGEQVVVHPIMRDRTSGGGPVGESYSAVEEVIAQQVAQLQDGGVDHPMFDARLETLRRVFAEHAANEERDEFPRLRTFVPAQRLHLMANELCNVQVMN